ncbi:hypothetical protein PR202_gb14031 [Eleusine coracana subsp. coracana]|uniref:Uncharacterized protein n=1 Tax=Eleusine coracana subsp. coracana TaxID=191504 RepID=A0AAV5EUD2_ELECO|nr:hypothetical protein PR202_gb14031 [Eleusine coracana subsp. coracana]
MKKVVRAALLRSAMGESEERIAGGDGWRERGAQLLQEVVVDAAKRVNLSSIVREFVQHGKEALSAVRGEQIHCQEELALDGTRRVLEVKAVLGARGDVEWEECSDAVGDAMHGDVMKSVRPQVRRFSGEQRGCCCTMGSRTSVTASCPRRPDERLTDLDWDGLLAFHDAERLAVWRLNAGKEEEELAGYMHAVVYGVGQWVCHSFSACLSLCFLWTEGYFCTNSSNYSQEAGRDYHLQDRHAATAGCLLLAAAWPEEKAHHTPRMSLVVQDAPMIFASTLPVMKRSSAVLRRGFDIFYVVFVTTHKTGEHKTVMPDSLRLSLSCC